MIQSSAVHNTRSNMLLLRIVFLLFSQDPPPPPPPPVSPFLGIMGRLQFNLPPGPQNWVIVSTRRGPGLPLKYQSVSGFNDVDRSLQKS